MQNINTCDYGHDTLQEVRVLPISKNGGNLIICRGHYESEIRFRQSENERLIKDNGGKYIEGILYSLPEWESLNIYNLE